MGSPLGKSRHYVIDCCEHVLDAGRKIRYARQSLSYPAFRPGRADKDSIGSESLAEQGIG